MRQDVAMIAPYRDGKILFNHRSKDDPRMPDYWGFFGGVIPDNETPLQTITRKARKEFDYDVKNLQFFNAKDFKIGDFYGTAHLFVEKFDHSQSIELREGQDMAWLTPEEFLKKKIAPSNVETVKLLAKRLFNTDL